MKHQHQDKLGREIAIDDCVAFPQSNSLMVGKVIKSNPKMLTIQAIDAKLRRWHSGEYRKYPADTVRLDSVDLTLYLLKHS